MARKVIGIIATVDFAFKQIVGNPKHRSITIHFLNSILGVRITGVTILNPILDKKSANDKLSVLDILAEDEFGRKYNVEVQTTNPLGTAQRMTYYGATLYVGQLTKGASYSSLRQAITICVLTESMFPEDRRLHLDFRMRDSSGLTLTDDLQIHLLELPKLQLEEENVRDAPPAEQWAYFLQNAHRMTPDDVKRIFPDQEFAEAAGVLEMISKTPEERQRYQSRLKFQRDEMAKRESEAARLELARVEGEEKGRVEGRVEGLREGEVKGELLGQIKLLQKLIGVSKPTSVELSSYDNKQLSELAKRLRKQLRGRGE